MIRFSKMQGAGNDYVYVNGFAERVDDPGAWARRMSDRHFGVGSDGLVLILPSERADFRMRMFNADGSEAGMCGNAARCVGKYVYDRGLTDRKELTLETRAGIRRLQLLTGADGRVERVCVDMGEPVLNPRSIPVRIAGKSVIGVPVEFDDWSVQITCVSMGNPHAVIFVGGELDDRWLQLGPLIESNELFPQRTNVEFVRVLSRTELQMRVWERGTGETWACGTGACASLVAAVLNGRTERKATVRLRGGNLEIEWLQADNRVYMTGGAVWVFDGEWPGSPAAR